MSTASVVRRCARRGPARYRSPAVPDAARRPALALVSVPALRATPRRWPRRAILAPLTARLLDTPDRELTVIAAVERLVGARVVGQRDVAGGYTFAAHRVASLSDGRTVFLKAAVDALTRDWLRAEQRLYASVRARFVPRCHGWGDAAATVLVLEDLSAAEWPPPWSRASVDAVLQALAEAHATAPPTWLPRPDDVDDLRAGWTRVAGDPEPFLSLGVCSRASLAGALPQLLKASQRAPLDGDSLLHLDVASGNLCIRDGRCLLVDWSNAARGNPLLDIAMWLPSLHLEGGPPPDELTEDGMAALAVVFAGYLACRAGLPELASAPRPGVRRFQLAQLKIALPWTSRCLDLPSPK
jgi:hypothetical protein